MEVIGEPIDGDDEGSGHGGHLDRGIYNGARFERPS
jgi:hypothetical protein